MEGKSFLRSSGRGNDMESRKSVFAKGLLMTLILVVSLSSVHALATKEEAEAALLQASRDIAEMQAAGLSVTFLNNTLDSAYKMLQGQTLSKTLDQMIVICQAYTKEVEKRYCEVQIEFLEALALKGNVTELSGSEVAYQKIRVFGEQISERKKQAFEALDMIRAVELKIVEYEKLGVNITGAVDLLNQSRQAIQEERYDEALELVKQADTELETKRGEFTLGNVIARASKGFIGRNKDTLAATLIVLLILAVVGYHPARLLLLRKQSHKLNAQHKALDTLIRQAQKDRFDTGKLSETVYNIRLGVYRKKLDSVKEELPLVEEKLKRYEKFENALKRDRNVVVEKSRPVVKLLKKSVHKIEKISHEMSRKGKRRK